MGYVGHEKEGSLVARGFLGCKRVPWLQDVEEAWHGTAATSAPPRCLHACMGKREGEQSLQMGLRLQGYIDTQIQTLAGMYAYCLSIAMSHRSFNL